MTPNRSQDEPAPKPYEFVPFAAAVRRTQGAGHERLDLDGRYSGRLIYRLEALTPVFVGAGSYALGEDAGFPAEPLVRPFHRVNGVPAIPGSSLKGVARSIVEAVSPSCVTVSRVRTEQLPPGVELSTGRRSTCTPVNSCPACGIFGRMSQLGRVTFGDAVLVSPGRRRSSFA